MRISRFDNLLVYEQDYTTTEIQRLIVTNNLDGLMILILLKDDYLEDISFIEGLSFLKNLSIVSNYEYDLSVISKLSNLESLSINSYGFSDGNLFNNLKIKRLNLSMRRGKFPLILPDTLDYLYLDEVNAPNFKFIEGARDLKGIEIKSSKISSLKGIEKFRILNELKMAGVSGLKEIGMEIPSSVKSIYLNQLRSLSIINLTHLATGVEVSIISCPKLTKNKEPNLDL